MGWLIQDAYAQGGGGAEGGARRDGERGEHLTVAIGCDGAEHDDLGTVIAPRDLDDIDQCDYLETALLGTVDIGSALSAGADAGQLLDLTLLQCR